MTSDFIEGKCMNCGQAIWYSWKGKHKKFFIPEYSNRPVDEHNLNEIDKHCPRCGIELDDQEVISKKILEGE